MNLTFPEKRRIAREASLKILYSYDVLINESKLAEETSIIDCINNFFDYFSTNLENNIPEIKEYILKLVNGVFNQWDKINELIEKFSENWEIDRMLIIDRNILRYAVFELLCCEDVPVKVVINEAIEIGKKYGNTESKKFINGILDKIKNNYNRGELICE